MSGDDTAASVIAALFNVLPGSELQPGQASAGTSASVGLVVEGAALPPFQEIPGARRAPLQNRRAEQRRANQHSLPKFADFA